MLIRRKYGEKVGESALPFLHQTHHQYHQQFVLEYLQWSLNQTLRQTHRQQLPYENAQNGILLTYDLIA